MATDKTHAPATRENPQVGESTRDYPHSSGDRNTKKSESDWKEFDGGKQRDAGPAPGTAPGTGKS